MCNCHSSGHHHEQPTVSRRHLLKTLAGGTAIAMAPGCASVATAFTPSPAQMAQAAAPAWDQLKQQQRVSTNSRYTSRVNRVAPRVLRAAGENPANWEVVTFEDKSLNAFALPNNKIGIHTGILDIMENDDQIAVVIGHEVGHVKLNHSGQRYGQQAATQLGLGVAGAVLDSRNVQSSQSIMQALGLGAQVGFLLPYSRDHELEADRLGLRYMPNANYDPREALAFWTRMANAKAQAAGSPPEFLSTHPADATRINFIRQELNAMGYAA